MDRHFRGNTITHVGSVCSVQNALDEDSGWIECFILLFQGGTPMYLPAWRLLDERGIAGVLRPPEPGGRIEPNLVIDLVRSWASGLHAHCEDVLRGENLDEGLFRRGS